VLAMEFSRGSSERREALRPLQQPEAGPQGGVSSSHRRRCTHSLKTEQRIAWSLARPDPGGSCLQGDNCLRQGQTRKAPSQ